jgi:hypothetical protein
MVEIQDILIIQMSTSSRGLLVFTDKNRPSTASAFAVKYMDRQ